MLEKPKRRPNMSELAGLGPMHTMRLYIDALKRLLLSPSILTFLCLLGLLDSHLAICIFSSTAVKRTVPQEECQQGHLQSLVMLQEQPSVRYKDTYRRQFAQTEARSLIQRTQPFQHRAPPEAVCLIATLPLQIGQDASEGKHIAGTLDIRPPANAGGLFPDGVPGSKGGTQARHFRLTGPQTVKI